MSEQSLKLGFIMGLLCPSEKKIQPTSKYKIGDLSCKTIKFPTNYSHTSTWVEKTFNGFSDINSLSIWSDGTHIYHSYGLYEGNVDYVLNGDTWEVKTWNVDITGSEIWTDGTNIYYSHGKNQYVLNGDTWIPKTWGGLNDFYGSNVWSDGTNIYYSNFKSPDWEQYVLNGDTWEVKTWNVNDFSDPWSDGENIYAVKQGVFSIGGIYLLNGDVWEKTSFDGFDLHYTGCFWSDGVNLYYSTSNTHYEFKNGAWVEKSWDVAIYGNNVWSDGTNIYHSTRYNPNRGSYVLK